MGYNKQRNEVRQVVDAILKLFFLVVRLWVSLALLVSLLTFVALILAVMFAGPYFLVSAIVSALGG